MQWALAPEGSFRRTGLKSIPRGFYETAVEFKGFLLFFYS
jgi:hypothetical protein